MGICSLSMRLLPFLLISQVIYAASLTQCDPAIHFDCKVGGLRKCIPLEWQCDNIPDCTNGLDEQNCNYLHHCSADLMMCRDGTCISSAFKCDGEADCPGGHEEQSCEGYSLDHLRPRESAPEIFRVHHEEECISPKFQCSIGHGCIEEEAVCDGVPDCPDGSDEANCRKILAKTTDVLSATTEDSKQCQDHHQRCANSDVCIPSYWVCDGAEDCSDGSDELNCDKENMDSAMEANKILCSADEYRCVGVRANCIPQAKTCDGVPDCFEGDDEDLKCNQCHVKGCRYKCHLTQTGAQCYCPDGSHLMSDGVSCSNINNCATKGGKDCQHFCSDNQDGQSYICSCAPGYSLGHDGHSCHLDKQEGHLLIGTGSAVRISPLYDPAHASTGYKDLKAGLTFPARGLEYDQKRKTLYLANSNGHDGELAVLVDNEEYNVLRKDIVGLNSLAVDFIGGNIYFTRKAPAKNPGIYVCSADGIFCRLIVSPLSEDAKKVDYRGFALNPGKGMMAWIEGYNNKYKILTANMDGTNIKVLTDNKLDNPYGLTFDAVKNELYFGDATDQVIEKINVETKERHAVVSKGVHHTFDIKYFDGFLYWSDWGTENIKSFQVSEYITKVLHTFDHFPMGIAINSSLNQVMPVKNPCDDIASYCKWMCVPVPDRQSPSQLSAECICPNDYVFSAEEKKCVPQARKRFFDESSLGITYMQGLCAAGTACFNDGSCIEQKSGQVIIRITCKCADGFTGDRCEVADPLAKTLIAPEDINSSGWGIFWFLFFIMIIAILAFLYLYKRNAAVNEFTKSTIDKVAHIESPDLSAIRPAVQNIKDKLQAIPGTLSSHFGQTQIPSSPEVDPATAPLVVAFNNPMYSEAQQPSTEATTDNEVTYVNKF